MKRNGFSIKILLVLMLAFSVFWGLAMYAVDCSIPCLARIPHRISGEIWFQLISSWLLALPSIGICAYALIQTKKYHDLDEERLRPELLMESAEVSMCMVNWAGFDQWAHGKDDIGVLQQEEYQRYRQKHAGKKTGHGKSGERYYNLGYLDFKSDLILKGGESVSRMTIKQVAIQIGNRRYLMKFTDTAEAGRSECEAGTHIFFSRSYKNGQEEYHIEWQPDYKDIVFVEDGQESQKLPKGHVWQEQDEDYDRMQKSFWDDMYNAVVDPEYDIARKDMEWRISMSIEYGTNSTRRRKMPESADWRIRWNGENREAVNDYAARQFSREGILSVG